MIFFKIDIFRVEKFSQAQHTLSDVFKTSVFAMQLSPNLFSSKPASIFTRNKTFCEHIGLLVVFGTMRLTGDLHQKNFSIFLKGFRFRKTVFLLFPVGDIAYLVFSSKVRNFLRKCLRSTVSPLCLLLIMLIAY